jgi:hypothetical protein
VYREEVVERVHERYLVVPWVLAWPSLA